MDLPLQQRRQREEQVLVEARKLIAELGYEGVTVRELARRSHVSVPTLYKWFGDKTALLVRAVESQFQAFLEHTRPEDASSVEALLALPEAAARVILDEPRYSRSVVSVFVAGGDSGGMMDAVAGAVADQLRRLLDEIGEAGELADWVDTHALADRLASLHVITCMQWAAGRIPDAAFGPSLVYGFAMTVLGATRGGARERLEERARQAQAALAEAASTTPPRRASR